MIKTKFKTWFFVILFIKIIIAMLFSSGYQDKLFRPFIHYFAINLDNPWQYFYENHYFNNPFPYPPLMLYITTASSFISSYLQLPVFTDNLLIKLPSICADVLIFYLLVKLYPFKKKQVLVYYFGSPIIFYAIYVHSQLDLLPTAVLFLSFFFLVKDRWKWASLIFGLALSIKFHVIAALPLIMIYLLKTNRNWRTLLYFLCTSVLVYVLICLPYIGSEGFRSYVLWNQEQTQVFDVFFVFGALKLYLAPLAIFIIYLRFLAYSKINYQLFFSFIGLLFSVFILVVPPMPAWYVWIIPYICIYFINQNESNIKNAISLNALLSITYLLYFMFFHHTTLGDISILGTPLSIKWNISHFANLSFTLLEGSLLAVIYFSYRYGIKNNSIYKLNQVPLMIGIGGDSGSGKSTLLDDIYKLLHDKEILLVEGDGDHKWERGHENWKQWTHLNPKANYLHRQSDDIMALKRGESIERVEYDHDTGGFTRPRKVKSKDYVIVSGLHPFYLPKMRKTLDIKIYLETEESLRRHWKVLRDTSKRGYSIEKVMSQIDDRMPDAQKYIWPQRQFADLVICYFSEENINIGSTECNPKLKLKLTVDSNLNLEDMINELEQQSVDVLHDYAEDLRTQYIIVDQEQKDVDFKLISNKIIQNREEIIFDDSIWHSNYRGVVQLLVLLMISEKLKEERQY